jgi:uncharacterized protein (TIGR03435 family)
MTWNATTLIAVVRIASIVACSSGLVWAQARDASPAFEVATIRPSGPDSGPMSLRRLPGGRFVTVNTPLPMLISWAFNVDEARLLNVPRGLGGARFDVVAKAPVEEPAPGQMQLMVRSLLAERFKLVVHNETRELTAYTLVVDNDGVKVKLSTAAEPPDANPFAMRAAGHLTGTRVTAGMLAKVLSNHLGRPVEDKTGLAGAFDFVLQWAPETAVPSADQELGSLFTAIREQLGFRLVARKTPVDVIVIDHVEPRPTDN